MTELLSRAQVARLIGCKPGWVRQWTAQRGITAVAGLNGWGNRYAYRAADIHTALDAQPLPAPLRLARFIRNPLNHTTPTTEENHQ